MADNGIFKRLKCILFPNRCACCGKVIESEIELCRLCEKKLKFIDIKICEKCGNPIKLCECNTHNLLYDRLLVPFFYDGAARQGILGIKYHGRANAAKFFAKCMYENATRIFPQISECDFICYVPMTAYEEEKKGYNQAQLLAKDFAVLLNKEVRDGALLKIKDNGYQHTMNNAKDRYANVKSVYGTANQRFDGCKIVLVDDIKTSGATLSECAKCLKLAGAEQVWCVTACVTPPRRTD